MRKLPPSSIVSRNDEINLYFVNLPPLFAHQFYPSVDPAAAAALVGAVCQINLALRNMAKGFARVLITGAREAHKFTLPQGQPGEINHLDCETVPLPSFLQRQTRTFEDNKEIRRLGRCKRERRGAGVLPVGPPQSPLPKPVSLTKW